MRLLPNNQHVPGIRVAVKKAELMELAENLTESAKIILGEVFDPALFHIWNEFEKDSIGRKRIVFKFAQSRPERDIDSLYHSLEIGNDSSFTESVVFEEFVRSRFPEKQVDLDVGV